jgi:antitoxin (DNA-binding transcriptional repressor) of toxin-antitoxin stability system
MLAAMDEIAVSKFKATCLAALDRVRRTGRPLRVTRFGRPLADVVPAQPEVAGTAWLGAMQGRGRVTADLVAPVADAGEWEALR